DLISDRGARDALAGEILLHHAAIAGDRPDFLLMIGPGRDQKGAVQLAAASADLDAPGDLQSLAFLDAVVMELVRVGIAGSPADADPDAELDADRRVRRSVALDPFEQEVGPELLGRVAELVVRQVRPLREQEVAREGV